MAGERINAPGISYRNRPVRSSLDAVEITQALVSIPSNKDESAVADWIEGFVAEHAPENFRSRRIPTDQPGRDTVIIANSLRPKILWISHIDTVDPWVVGEGQGQGQYEPFGGTIDGDWLYGRGASDQKSGAAALLAAISQFKGSPEQLPEMAIALTSREEFDMQGMEMLTKEIETTMREDPTYKLLFVGDTATDYEIGNACRGCTEFQMVFTGRTGHAAIVPKSGILPVSALIEGIDTVRSVGEYIKSLPETELGKTIYYITNNESGLRNADGSVDNRRVNQIPDVNRMTIGFRPNGNTLDGIKIGGKLIQELIIEEAQRRGLVAEVTKVHNDYPAWITPYEQISWFGDLVERVTGREVKRRDPRNRGFTEAGIIARTGAPTLIWGIGQAERMHAVDERVGVEDIKASVEVFAQSFLDPRFK